MDIKKFIAVDAREALKKVKETLGDDAVVLSNRTIPGGVEMTAIPQKDINDLPNAMSSNNPTANKTTTANANPNANSATKNKNLNSEELSQLLNNLKNKNSANQQNQQKQQNQQNQQNSPKPATKSINITDEDDIPNNNYKDLINAARSRLHQQNTAANKPAPAKISGNPSGQTLGQAMPQSVTQILKQATSRLAGNSAGFQQGGIIKNLSSNQINQVAQGLQNPNEGQTPQNYAPNNGLDRFNIPPNNPPMIPPSALRMDPNTAARQAKMKALARPVVFPNKDDDDPILQPGTTVNAGIPKMGSLMGGGRKHSLLATASATKNLSALIQSGNQNLQNNQKNSTNSRGNLVNANTNANMMIPDEVMEEIKELRQIVEQHLVGFAWGEDAKRDPMRNEMMRIMLDSGFSPQFAREILVDMPSEIAVKDKAFAWLKGATDRCLNLSSPGDDIVDKGGVYALVGPTGVGKTTTTAKLAARCVLRHGPGKISLITTDSYRIGAHEQLRIYGRILGVSVNLAKDSQELQEILNELQSKHMVLIDTMGMSQKDKLVPELTEMLTNCHVQRILLLNATSRGDTLDDVVNAYQGGGLSGCIVTKIDEADSLASALDVVIRNRLKLFYVSNGQRVPEDLHLPNRSYLLHRAFRERSTQSPHHYEDIEPALMVASKPLPISSTSKDGESFLSSIKKNLANKPKVVAKTTNKNNKENSTENPEKKQEISRKIAQKVQQQNKTQSRPTKKSKYEEFTDELNDDDFYEDFNEDNDNNSLDEFSEFNDNELNEFDNDDELNDDDFLAESKATKLAEIKKKKYLEQQKKQLLEQQRRLLKQKKALETTKRKEPIIAKKTTKSKRDEDEDLYNDFLNDNDDLDDLDDLDSDDLTNFANKKTRK